MIDIQNVRLGLATNSSSTHSIIFLSDKAAIPTSNDWPEGEGHFGWGYFTAATEKAKMTYLALLVRSQLAGFHGEDIGDLVTKAWTGSLPEKGAYIDHQSFITLPSSWDEKSIDKLFFNHFKKFLLDKRTLILGGNDNGGNEHPLQDMGGKLDIQMPGYGASVARYDKPGNYWTLFDRNSGDKVRMRFAPGGKSTPILKAYAPELVDVKITDFCPFNCAYCYQGSTMAGQHADIGTLRRLAKALGYLRVFEVAIGGGEPTLYPNLAHVLWLFREEGVVPNFTTKSLEWLRNDRQRHEIMEQVGAVAYSVTCDADVEKLASYIDTYELDRNKFAVQAVVGTMPEYSLRTIMTKAAQRNIPLTLLGFKTTGRGKGFKQVASGSWIQMVQELHTKSMYPTLGIDTALAAACAEEIKKAKVPDYLYSVEEGKFSMYIDAVASAMGPSSYSSSQMYKADMSEVEPIQKAILSCFKTF